MKVTIEFLDKGNGDYTAQQTFTGDIPVTALVSVLKQTASGLEQRAAKYITDKLKAGHVDVEAELELLTIRDIGQ